MAKKAIDDHFAALKAAAEQGGGQESTQPNQPHPEELVVEEPKGEDEDHSQRARAVAEAAASELAEEVAMEREHAEKRAIWTAEMERRASEGTVVYTVTAAAEIADNRGSRMNANAGDASGARRATHSCR